MHFASFEVVSVKDLKLYYRGHLSFLWTSTKKGETWDSQSVGKTKMALHDRCFANPQSHGGVVAWPEFLSRRLGPAVRGAGWEKVLVHGRLRWIVSRVTFVSSRTSEFHVFVFKVGFRMNLYVLRRKLTSAIKRNIFPVYTRVSQLPGGWVLPYKRHIGICCCEVYGFPAVYSKHS